MELQEQQRNDEEQPLNKQQKHKVSNIENPTCSKNAILYFRDFSLNASLDGLKFVGEKGRNIFERLFWVVTLIIALILCIILIVQTFQKWINSPVLVTFATTQTPIFEIPFPAITICPEIKSRKYLFNFTDVYIKKLLEKELTVNESLGFEYLSLVCDPDQDLLEDYPAKTNISAMDFITAVAPDFIESVIELHWRSKEYTSDASQLFVPTLTSEGVCYSFNVVDRAELFTEIVAPYKSFFSTNGKTAEWSSEDGYRSGSNSSSYPHRTLIAGTKGGLSIVFKINGDDLDYACGDSLQGFKVTLHNPAALPRVKQSYFRLPLDQSVLATVKPNVMSTSKNLRSYKPEDRKCYFVNEKHLKYFRIYNQENCLVECLTNYTLHKCGCLNFHLREEATAICGADSMECVDNAKALFMTSEVNYKIARKKLGNVAAETDLGNPKSNFHCDCLPSCFSLDFDVETSQSDWDWMETFKVLRHTDSWNEELESIFNSNRNPYKNFFSTNGKTAEWSPENGYRSGSNSSSYPHRTLISGTKGGISIIFKVSGDDLDYACGDSLQGFKVTLHNPAALPRVKQSYFRLPLDQSVLAAVKPNVMDTSKNLRNYKPEDRKCYFVNEKHLKYFKIYNQENCLVECLTNYTLYKCGCLNFHLREERTPICGANSMECVDDAEARFMTSEVNYKIRQKKFKNVATEIDLDNLESNYHCDCLPSCFSLDFDVETSQSDWDWRETLKVFRHTESWDESAEHILHSNRLHLMRLEISFKDMQFLGSERNELYGYVDFWANIGGVIGLFTGFSFITMFEIVYYATLRLSCNIKMFGRAYWSGDEDVLAAAEVKKSHM